MQMAREIQNQITGTESLLNGESMERAATRSPCRMIRSLVAQEETNTGRTALVPNCLDLCKTVLVGTTKTLQHQLQSVFNAAARLVFSARRSKHVMPLLHDIHCLKVLE